MLTNQFMKIDLAPKQLAFCMLPHLEALYGGAAGGMKSETLLYDATRNLHIPGFSAILFRRTLTDHELPSALIPRAKKYLMDPEVRHKPEKNRVRWDGSGHRFIIKCWYPDGTRGPDSYLQFGYIGEADQFLRYQSSEYQYIGWDEITQHLIDNYLYMFSRLRKCVCPIHRTLEGEPNYVPGCMRCEVSKSVPLKVRGATNPGGPGHSAFKNRFKIIAVKGKDGKPLQDKYGHKIFVSENPKETPFLQSFLEDNPFIDQKSYRKGLEQLPTLEKARLLHGDWDVNPDARFQLSDFPRYRYNDINPNYLHVGKRLLGKNDLDIFITIDPAASSMEGLGPDCKKDERSWFVISVWGLTEDKHLLMLDMDRFQEEIPEGIKRCKRMFRKWQCRGYCEKNGPGAGVYQELVVSSFPVAPVTKIRDKVVNATEAQIRAAQHRIWLPEYTHWVKPVEDELSTWTGGASETDDIIDTMADAARFVAWGEVGAADMTDAPRGHFSETACSEFPDIVPLDTVDPYYNNQYYGRHYG